MSTKTTPLWLLSIKDVTIRVIQINDEDYINLTDMIKEYGEDSIKNWMRSKDTLEFLGVWEQLYNQNFRTVEFDRLRNEAWTNRFLMSVKKRTDATWAIWILSKKGKVGAWTFAHKDIAFEFASRLNPIFKLYIIKEFQRLKQDESVLSKLEWNTNRVLSKINYRIHTDAVKNHIIIPRKLSGQDTQITYASEADLINKAHFGVTAKEWRTQNPDKKWNIRDDATISQLLILANLESYNAELIKQWISQSERLTILNQTAIDQAISLSLQVSLQQINTIQSLPNKNKKIK